MTFGQQNTETETYSQRDYALERGINFMDMTPSVYRRDRTRSEIHAEQGSPERCRKRQANRKGKWCLHQGQMQDGCAVRADGIRCRTAAQFVLGLKDEVLREDLISDG